MLELPAFNLTCNVTVFEDCEEVIVISTVSPERTARGLISTFVETI
jgi:hypothetical protein